MERLHSYRVFTLNHREIRITVSLQRLAFISMNPVRIGDGVLNIARSEEHTSELQSLMRPSHAVFCLNQTNIMLTRYLTSLNQRQSLHHPTPYPPLIPSSNTTHTI